MISRLEPIVCLFAVLSLVNADTALGDEYPLGPPGTVTTYQLVGDANASDVATLAVAFGAVAEVDSRPHQWLHLDMIKGDGNHFRVWLLTATRPPADLDDARGTVARYILQQNGLQPVEFRHRVTAEAVLPTSGAWPFLFPDPPSEVTEFLGLEYKRAARFKTEPIGPPDEVRVVELRPDVLMGKPHNTKEADETRRFDDSEYEYIPLDDADFEAMMAAGMNCFHADESLLSKFEDAAVFYWGVDAGAMPYPECLYDPRYIGPAIFIDEPAVHARDFTLRPKLREDPAFRKAITPQIALEALKTQFEHVIADAGPTYFTKQLAARDDVNLGSMRFAQANLYSWETMISGAAYELNYSKETPGAIVFEPPGRVGARRLLPGWNIAFGCQIPVTSTDYLTDIVAAFLRGAARATDKEWGISIYGSVDQSDAFAMLRRAYDLGATRFFYWDYHRLATVPFGEALDLSKYLTIHAEQYPHRDLDELLHAAEIAILFPPGYNLGHVYMNRGVLWGVPELNLERKNAEGVPYRTVMQNVFTEIERCLRHGVAFDLLWDLDDLKIDGYREVVRVREDGTVEVTTGETTEVLETARIPDRPDGDGPSITISLSESTGKTPLTIDVQAYVVPGDAPIYYSHRPNDQGVHRNDRVAWELYGPNEEDYTHRAPTIVPGAIVPGAITPHDEGGHVIAAEIHVEKPGTYRLRAATCDLAGRTAVAWNEIVATE